MLHIREISLASLHTDVTHRPIHPVMHTMFIRQDKHKNKNINHATHTRRWHSSARAGLHLFPRLRLSTPPRTQPPHGLRRGKDVSCRGLTLLTDASRTNLHTKTIKFSAFPKNTPLTRLSTPANRCGDCNDTEGTATPPCPPAHRPRRRRPRNTQKLLYSGERSFIQVRGPSFR
ncbi:unnamed protein product [Ectocarpus sp. 8 AP-2014]